MPFDSFMTSALTHELSNRLTGLKVDKVCQPEKDEVDLIFHFQGRNRLVINCTASTPYMALTQRVRENPPTPPMMCMLLRKHLSRAKITAVEQMGFDRVIRITFDSGDELGFRKSKYLYCEMMGRGSNLIFADEDGKILAAFRQNDITTKFDRVIMVGMPYRPMPPRDQIDPMECIERDFLLQFEDLSEETRLDTFLQKRFSGFGKLTAREIVFLAAQDCEATLKNVDLKKLWKSFSQVVEKVKNADYSPCLIFESKEAFEGGETPLDFSFMPITQYSAPFYVHSCQSVSEAVEQFYEKRNEGERHRQHVNSIAQILKNCKSRLEKKISVQTLQLEEAKGAEASKKFGDLIMQEMYRIKKGDEEVKAMDYESMEERIIPLDPFLTPSGNAQRYYKDYAKKKTAAVKMQEQIAIAQAELNYAESVSATLATATTARALDEIREELSHWNYGRRLTSGLKKPQKKPLRAKPAEGKTKNGFVFYVGMNNFQNDTVSTHLAEKEDMWFHVKNYHGSHVLLKAVPGKEFSDEDLTEAAGLAAYYSEVRTSPRVEVDYTKARYVKKPNGAKPGFVTYKNHNTAFVKPLGIK